MVLHERFDVSREKLAELCEHHHVRELALFGSVLRDDFRDDSDIDVLVEFEPDPHVGLFRFGELRKDLSDLLGHEVDLVSKGGLNKHIRQHVLEFSETIYTPGTGYRVRPERRTTGT